MILSGNADQSWSKKIHQDPRDPDSLCHPPHDRFLVPVFSSFYGTAGVRNELTQSVSGSCSSLVTVYRYRYVPVRSLLPNWRQNSWTSRNAALRSFVNHHRRWLYLSYYGQQATRS